jgi:hypothetical protein
MVLSLVFLSLSEGMLARLFWPQVLSQRSNFSIEYYRIFLSFSVLGGISASTLFTLPVAAVGH